VFLGLLDLDPNLLVKGSGSGSFNHEAKIVRKASNSTVLGFLFDFLPLENDVKVPLKSNMQKNLFLN
jgi:hypothetical protein